MAGFHRTDDDRGRDGLLVTGGFGDDGDFHELIRQRRHQRDARPPNDSESARAVRLSGTRRSRQRQVTVFLIKD